MDDRPSGPVSVKRWRRYGMDRLYVTESDGRTIGWCDLVTGEPVIQLRNRSDAFQIAIAEWVDAHCDELATSDARQGVARPTDWDATEEPSLDLAQNIPGQGLRARAVTEQRKYPVTSFLARVLKIHTQERA